MRRKHRLAEGTSKAILDLRMIAETNPQLSSLTADDKILLAVELWREAAGSEGAPPHPDLVAALRERLDHYRDHPTEVSTWSEVRARIVSQTSGPNA